MILVSVTSQFVTRTTVRRVFARWRHMMQPLPHYCNHLFVYLSVILTIVWGGVIEQMFRGNSSGRQSYGHPGAELFRVANEFCSIKWNRPQHDNAMYSPSTDRRNFVIVTLSCIVT